MSNELPPAASESSSVIQFVQNKSKPSSVKSRDPLFFFEEEEEVEVEDEGCEKGVREGRRRRC